jgi:hypothetical protein
MRCYQYSCFKQRAFTWEVIKGGIPHKPSCFTTYNCEGFTLKKTQLLRFYYHCRGRHWAETRSLGWNALGRVSRCWHPMVIFPIPLTRLPHFQNSPRTKAESAFQHIHPFSPLGRGHSALPPSEVPGRCGGGTQQLPHLPSASNSIDLIQVNG